MSTNSALPLRRLGKTGLMVTAIGFGGIPIQMYDKANALATVRRAHDMGVNFFDTARAYTVSEEWIGEALEGRDYIVATKSGVRDANGIYEEVCHSLRNLRRNQIDLYQFHGANYEVDIDKILAPDGAMAGLLQAQAEGKIAHIGITGHRVDILIRALQVSELFETVQVPFNIVEDQATAELFPLCAHKNVGTIAMKPAGGGNFSNPALSVKWTLTQEVTVAIPGMGTVAEVEEDVSFALGNLALTPDELAECDRMKAELGPRTCRRCNYCDPCPHGVNIFLALNGKAIMHRMGVQRFIDWGAKQVIEGARNCQECGVCVTRCPYSLPIPELIRENLAYYDTMPELG